MRRIFTLMLLISGCWGVLTAQPYRVGDLYTAPDGSKGIVYHVLPDGSGAWAVALNDASASCAWGDLANVPLLADQHPANPQVLLYDTSGFSSTQILRSHQNNNAYAAGVVDFGNGWCLPSPAQLRMLQARMPLVADAIIAAGGSYMALDWYWTCAERNGTEAWQVDFGHNVYHGRFRPAFKSDLCHVRAVRLLTYEPSYVWSDGSTGPTLTVSPAQTTAYTVTASNPIGCNDSAGATVTVTRNETVLPPVTVCDNYIWHGDTLTQPGEYTHTITNATGCDSVEILLLTVNYCVETDTTVCADKMPFTWNGVLFTSESTQETTLTAANGADSIVTMTVHVHPSPMAHISGPYLFCTDSLVTLTADSAAAYLWSTGDTSRAILAAAEGPYSVTVTDANGCTGTATHQLKEIADPILAIEMPVICSGNTYPVTMGYREGSNILLAAGATTTLTRMDTVFLPDGIYCDPYGCSYRSPLTFTAYEDNDVIQSVEDIYYVRLNMEHSYIGDLYINITCPNGQRADLMKYYGTGTSNCNSQIPLSSRGWQSGYNMPLNTFFGIAHDYSSPTCNAGDYGNEQGVGWNYCWSENTTQGYLYAPGDGSLIYRSGNQHYGIVDSSNVAAGTNFYHPDDPFTNLIGCPLNGDWYIEVLDGWGGDNGYIFGWELALSREALPDAVFGFSTSTADGPWITQTSDSTFVIQPPAGLENDTVVTYTFTVYNDFGCGYDTAVNVVIHTPSRTSIDTSFCDSITIKDITYTENGQITTTYTNVFGCDSIVTLNLALLPATDSTLQVTVVQNSLPYMLNGTPYSTPGIYTQHLENANGCDSVLTVVFEVLYNVTDSVDTVICPNALPYLWNDSLYETPGSHTQVFTAANGADSIVTMTIHVHPSPMAHISGPYLFCLDSLVTLTADSAVAYLWSTGDTSRAILAAAEGPYSVTVTDANGCTGTATHQLKEIADPILAVDIPEICAGDTYPVTMGYQEGSNILLGSGVTTLTLVDTIFLPDGIYCDPHGCSYRSPLTFTAYGDNDVIQSVEDIYYVRLNMEHSWIGDLYINITCPNGQRADLMKYGGTGTSDCNSQIPPSSQGWQDGNNMYMSTFLGQAYDFQANTCNSSSFGNEPGVGWNYCWSENTTQGYTYAPGAGSLIYRDEHAHDGIVDSSDVATGTNFYHPDDPFTNLIGCPLNGDWYIEVQDGWGGDNGYIFGWELALSREALPDAVFNFTTSTADGPWITQNDDSTFVIQPPAGLVSDTVVTYTFTVYNDFGCGYDTTVSVVIHAPSHASVDTSFCDDITIEGITYTEAGQHTLTYTNVFGCDSIVTLNLALLPATDSTLQVTVVQNSLPYMLNGTPYSTPGTYTQHLENANGCDSVLTVVFEVLYNVTDSVDTVICPNALPYLWNDSLYETPGSHTQVFTAANGTDSIVVTTITLRPQPSAAITGSQYLCENGNVPLTADSAVAYLWSTGDTSRSILAYASGNYTLTVTDEHGCTGVASHVVFASYNPILEVSMPEVCAGGNYPLTSGYQEGSNILLGGGATTLSLVDTIFLPDGIYCDPHGCSYRSPLTFTAYGDNDIIQSVEDIYYVRLNMEHSFIGDLYINITCPNGQRADLMKYGGTGMSDCNSQIAPSSRGWQSGYNMSRSTFFGDAHDYSTPNCNADAYGNEQGVGWNYCWSNNTTQGYLYAPGDGSLIYRGENQHNSRVDSSNVAAGTQFYHPDDSFESLVGCPMNGDWYIEVLDGWDGDNGYIFGWELALRAEAIDTLQAAYTHTSVDGPWITASSDSAFVLSPPDTLPHDTVVAYTFHIHDDFGCSYDTTVNITIRTSTNAIVDSSFCNSISFGGITYTATGTYIQNYSNAFGCDSIVTLNLTLLPATDSTLQVTVVQNSLPYMLNGTPYSTPGTYTQHLENANGCDSVLTLLLDVNYNVTSQVDTTVCAADMPFTWHGHTFTSTGSHSVTLQNSHGADSTVTYSLAVDNLAAATGTVTPVTCFGEASGAATAVVTGGTGPFNYSWTDAAGTAVAASPAVGNRPAGDYTFTVTDLTGCTASLAVSIGTLNGELLAGSIADNQELCDGDAPAPFSGTAASGGDNGAYLWQISYDGAEWAPAPGTNDTQDYPFPGIPDGSFSLRRAWVTMSCGTAYSNTLDVHVWPVYNDTLVADICQGEPFQESGFDIHAEQTALPGDYIFEQQHSTGHCDSSITLRLAVHPRFETSIEEVICEGDGYFENGFSIPKTMTLQVDSIRRALNLATVNGCDSTVNLRLTIIDTALRIRSLTEDFCESMSADLLVTSPMPDYLWNTGETSQSITVNVPGIYSVTASQEGCENTAHIRVNGCQQQFHLPNAITPSDADGLNDLFCLPENIRNDISLFEIDIFNRWGELVFHSNDKNFQWNGEFRGQIHCQTVYTYLIRYSDNSGRPFRLTGSVTVL